MSEDWIDEAFKTYGLEQVISDLSIGIGENMLQLIYIYKNYYGKTNIKFLRVCIEELFKNHRKYVIFKNRGDISDEVKSTLVSTVVNRLYKIGEDWLRKNGYAVPER